MRNTCVSWHNLSFLKSLSSHFSPADKVYFLNIFAAGQNNTTFCRKISMLLFSRLGGFTISLKVDSWAPQSCHVSDPNLSMIFKFINMGLVMLNLVLKLFLFFHITRNKPQHLTPSKLSIQHTPPQLLAHFSNNNSNSIIRSMVPK